MKIPGYEIKDGHIIVFPIEERMRERLVSHLNAKKVFVGSKPGAEDGTVEIFTLASLDELNEAIADFPERDQ